jgi:hypothetical protein
MNPERAKEIIADAHAKAVHGPWSDQIDNVMRPGEREEVNAVWDTMPGNTCFVDALYRIRDGQATDFKAVPYSSALYDQGVHPGGGALGRPGPTAYLIAEIDLRDRESLSRALRRAKILKENSAHVRVFDVLTTQIHITPAWEVNQPYPLLGVILTRVEEP